MWNQSFDARQRRSGHSRRTGPGYCQSPGARAGRWSAARRTRPGSSDEVLDGPGPGRDSGPPFSIKAISLFEEIVAQAPSFAPAWAGLSSAAGSLGEVGAGVLRGILPGMREAALEAFRLDPVLAEANAAMGSGRGLRPQLDGGRASSLQTPSARTRASPGSQRRGRFPAASARPTRRSD